MWELSDWWQILASHNLESGIIKHVRQSWVVYTVWEIWLDRNKYSFWNKASSPKNIIDKVTIAVAEQFNGLIPFAKQQDDDFFASLGITVELQQAYPPVQVKWQAPHVDGLKLILMVPGNIHLAWEVSVCDSQLRRSVTSSFPQINSILHTLKS